jgi:hypothetical protein
MEAELFAEVLEIDPAELNDNSSERRLQPGPDGPAT